MLCAIILLAGWIFDFRFLRTPVLTPFGRLPPLTPIYGFWMPLVRPQMLLFVSAALLVGLFAPRLVNPDQVKGSVFAIASFAAGMLLPLMLFWARQEPSEIGRQFLIYPGEEFFFDARKITDLTDFLKHYVELMPTLSLHGRHFPPGHAILLYLVRILFGAGTLPTGIVVLVAFALGVAMAYAAMRGYSGERAARQATLLLLASPSMLNFACTSMDAVFFLYACFAWWAGMRAFSEPVHTRKGIASGLLLLLAVNASFSGILIGLILALYGLAKYRQLGRSSLVQLSVIGTSFVAGATAVYLLTGFSLWSCFETARLQNVAFMRGVIGRSPESLYGKIAFGNLFAFAIGSGLALVPILMIRLSSRRPRVDLWTGVTLITLSVMTFGGFYLMETERIWLYAIPWLSLAALSGGPIQDDELQLLLSAGWIQSLMMETLIFTLW